MAYIIDLSVNALKQQERLALELRHNRQVKTQPQAMKRVISALLVVSDEDNQTLTNTLTDLAVQPLLLDIIVVDKRLSTQTSQQLEKLRQVHPRLYVVNGHAKLSLGASLNLGARFATGKHLLFLDACVRLEPNVLLKLLQTGINKPTPWLIGAGNESQTRQVSLAGGGFHVPKLMTPCLLIPAKTFQQLEGFNKYYEFQEMQADLCLRIHLAGGSVYQADAIQFTKQPSPKLAWSAQAKQVLRETRSWYHYQQQYLSFDTNRLWVFFVKVKLGIQAWLMLLKRIITIR